MKTGTLRAAGCLLGFAAAAACTLREVPRDYPPPLEMPAFYARDTAGTERPAPWWEAFGDRRLSEAISAALAENAGLGQARARLRQAESSARLAGAASAPEVTASADVSRSRTSVNIGGELGERDVTSSLYAVSLAAGYEADLWGKIEALEEAALAAVTATREDLDSAAMTLAAGLAETWLAIAEEKEQLHLLHRQSEVGRTFLHLVELRFAVGLASAADVFQQRQQLAATESRLPGAEARLAVLRHQLAVLLGRPAGSVGVDLPDNLPSLPPAPAAGIPSDLIRNRPDVRAAHARVGAADYRLAEVMADRYPSLRLSGRAGFQWREVSSLFDNWVYQIAAQLAGPVFDGGRRSEAVTKQKAVVEEMLEIYRQTLLDALKEVEDALVQEVRQDEYLRQVEKRMDIARETLERTRHRYGQGQSDYLPVVSSLLALQNLERESISARRQRLAYRIQLYRALGGSWIFEAPSPDGQGFSDAGGRLP